MAAVKRQIIKREIVEWEVLEYGDGVERRPKLASSTTSEASETRDVVEGQSVEIGIIYRPSARHLHLDHQLPKPTISLRNGPVRWRVYVDEPERPSTVKLWFPSGVFTENEKEIKIDNGYGEALLTPNAEFLPDDSPIITVPLAVFCNIDGGQDEDRTNSKYRQKGFQMVDGPHSHPECNVGP
jgi:hypothetical protein